MILGFKGRFVPKILDGTKIHTFREDKKNRWKKGNKIHGATGVRTKRYKQFFEDVCKSTQKIVMKYVDKNEYVDLEITVDNYKLTPAEKAILAVNDGFETFDDFKKWFDKDFKGKIIHWTDYRY